MQHRERAVAFRYTGGLAILIGLIGIACSDAGVVEQPPVPSPQTIAAERIDAVGPALGELLRERFSQTVDPGDLRATIVASPLLDEVDDRYRDLLLVNYAERRYHHIFIEDGRLGQAGELVLAQLSDSWAHSLAPDDYWPQELLEHRQTVESVATVMESYGSFPIIQEDQEALIDFMSRRPELLEMESTELAQTLLTAILEPAEGETSAHPALREQFLAESESLSAFEEAQVELEMLLAAAYIRYAYDIRFFNTIWFDETVRDDPVLLEAGTREQLLDTIRQGADGPGFEASFAALLPHHPQYDLLVSANRFYRELATNGGWEPVENRAVSLGREYDMIPQLRQRLAVEGYFDGDLLSQEFDRELRSALETYQRTHQFRENGQLSEGVVNSLNTSALDRARQVALTVTRWRESGIGMDSYYIFVNVPDFHTEVWRDGNRDMRFRTIVGSTEHFRSRETGEIVYRRATPVIHRPLRYIVFNPYWNVPQQIMIQEYDPNLEENPLWYEENGYEVMMSERGTRWVRMLPGPENVLGEVKFLFPNEHDVYMHDTSSRRLFDRTIRSFSHGCMRIQDPLELAEYLLSNDRGWDRDRIDREREDGEEKWVTLRTPIQVHVEYYVVRVDDDGYANFLSDLYRRDRPRLSEMAIQEVAEAVEGALQQISHSVSMAAERAEQTPENTRTVTHPTPDQSMGGNTVEGRYSLATRL